MALRKTSRRPSPSRGRSRIAPRPRSQGGPSGQGRSAFYAAGPAVGLALQAKVKIGRRGDAYEREADGVAERVAANQPVATISRLPARGLSAQRAENGEEDVQEQTQDEEVQEQSEEEEVQEQAEEEEVQEQSEEEEVQERSEEEEVQEQSEEEEVQEQGEEEEVQEQSEEEEVQEQAEEEEVQEQAEEEEVQEQAEEEEVQEQSEEEEVQEVQRKAAAPGRLETETAGHAIRSAGLGEPMRPTTRERLEPSLGVDLSDVRVHQDASAGETARKLKARAFTHKNHIWLASGESQDDVRLMAHETTHVLQQDGVVRRQPAAETAASGGPPAEAEKAAALAKAQQAENLGKQQKAAGKAEILESKKGAAAEREQKMAAKAEGQQAVESAKTPPKEAGGAERAGAAGAVGAKPAKEGGAAAGGAPPPTRSGDASPASAEEDPSFQAVVGAVEAVGDEQKEHEPAAAKAGEAQAAARSPESEIAGEAQANQVDAMEEAEEPPFDKAKFKQQLMARIAELAPKTTEEADKFKDQNSLGTVRSEAQGQVAQERQAAQAPMAEATSAAPDTSGVERRETTPIPAADPGAAPADVAAARAAPPPRTATEVETPLTEQTAAIDERMAEEGITEEQLARSNEPQFQAALDARNEARAHAREAPESYRAFEGEHLQQAQGAAAETAREKTRAMHGERADLLAQVEGGQDESRARNEAQRAEIAGHINGIYDRTKSRVETLLSDLDGEVEKAFDEGSAAAKELFEKYVDVHMTVWKYRRYGGLLGWTQWLKDLVLSPPPEVNDIYARGRKFFLQKMEAVVDKVVAIIGKRLTEAKAEIKKGKKEIKDYVAQLPEALRQIGQEAQENVQSRFDVLEASVEDKQGELIDTLAAKYQESLEAVDARIEEMKEANKGLVDKAKEWVDGVIETIKKLKQMLNRILAKIADVVNLILADPIAFLGNLIDGLKQGFQKFADNILKHLQAGFIAWLTGAMGPVGIQIPDDIFSLKGIFSLVMQILGLTWENIRRRAVKFLGEPVVKALETGFEIFKILITEGPAGLWRYVKEQFSNLKEMVLDAIKDMLITEVIKAGVKWLLGMLNPAGALIKAAMTIYQIVMFFVEKAQQILALIEAIVDAVGAIARGSISVGAQLVENALARTIPLIIGFLARLLGLGGLAKKVQKIIQRVRKPIQRAIDMILKKAKKFARKLIKTGQAGLAKLKDILLPKKSFRVGDESHELSFKGEGATARPMVASKKPRTLAALLDALKVRPENKGKPQVGQARTKLGELTKLQGLLKKATTEPAQEKCRKKINTTIAEIAKLLVFLMRGDTFGTKKSTALDVQWPKPASVNYPTLYFGPKSGQRIPQTTLKSAHGGNANMLAAVKNKLNDAQLEEWKGRSFKIDVYSPHSSQSLPGSGPKVGLTTKWRVSVGKKLQLPKSPPGSTPGGSALNKKLAAYGFRAQAEDKDADHVVEIQLGGKDEPGNLWPLKSSINRGAGSRLSRAVLKAPTGDKIPMSVLKTRARSGTPVWLNIKSTA